MELTSVADDSLLRKLHGEFLQLCMKGEVGAVEQPGKSGSQMKLIHILVADSTNPKMHLPFGSPVGVLFLMFYTQFGDRLSHFTAEGP
jgi:hypothetical protein